MRNIIVSFFVFGLLAILIVGLFNVKNGDENATPDYLRIHIRANSNDIADQDIKYKVKEQVVNVLTPLLSKVTTKQSAMTTIENNLSLIEKTADDVLTANGFEYRSSAKLHKENFPERVYDGITVAGGVYDALILNLGSGSGDNWWCVVYPPLCFIDNTIEGDKGVIYKSKIKEIIDRITKN